MKHVSLKYFLAALVVVLFPLVAGAIDFQQDGIAYRTLTDSTVTVTTSNNVNYSGDVVIPATVTNDGVTYVVTKINSYAFSKRTSLNSVTIPPTIQKMELNAFDECPNMTAVYISDLVAWMNIDFAYSGNPLSYAHHLYLDGVEVQDFVIPDSLTTIKPYIFHGCTGFRSLFIPSFVTDISYSAFYMCGGLTSIQVEEGNTVFDSRDNCNAVIKKRSSELWIGCENTVIPSSVNTIGYCAFSGRTGITSMELHSGIHSIGNMAFEGCTGLTEINIPYNATYIGSAAFRGCTGLTQMDTRNVYTIGSCAFMECSNLSQVFISHNIKRLENAVFKDCTSLLEIEIPDRVETIINSCFHSCSSLRSVKFGNSLKEIDGSAFAHCSSLTSVVLPPSLEQLDQCAFAYCTSLEELQINGKSLAIDCYVVEGCDKLTELFIPACVKQIEPLAFVKAPNLVSITVDPGNAVYDSRDSCNAIIETATNTLIEGFSVSVIPSSVTAIGICAYWYVKGVSELALPESIKSIGSSAFEYSDITKLYLPNIETLDDWALSRCDELTELYLGKNISSIGRYPLSDCSSLKSLTCMAPVPPVLTTDVTTVSNLYYSATLKVPETAVEAYKNADHWKKFRNIVGVPDAIAGDIDGNGVLSIGDVTGIIDALLRGDVNNPAADLNGDGRVSIQDVTMLIDILLNN